MKRDQKNPSNITEAINILQTQIYSLCFSTNSLSKEKKSSLIADLEHSWISDCVLHCFVVRILLRRYLLRRSNIVRQFEKSLIFSFKKKKKSN